MRYVIADWIQYVIDNVKLPSAKKTDTLLDIQNRIIGAKELIREDVIKIKDNNLETKLDADGNPIVENGEAIKFISEQGRKELAEIELDVKLNKQEVTLIKSCIDNILWNLYVEKAEDLYSIRINLVWLYRSIA